MKCLLLLFFLLATLPAGAQTRITDLKVQHSDRPLAIEDRHPVFSWKMESTEQGQYQAAYRLTVTRESDGSRLWDSGKVQDGRSVGIPYLGVALQPEKGYGVALQVWDKDGAVHEAETRFETGLMNPRQSAWKGAGWIGSKELTLDAASQSIFDIATEIRILRG